MCTSRAVSKLQMYDAVFIATPVLRVDTIAAIPVPSRKCLFATAIFPGEVNVYLLFALKKWFTCESLGTAMEQKPKTRKLGRTWLSLWNRGRRQRACDEARGATRLVDRRMAAFQHPLFFGRAMVPSVHMMLRTCVTPAWRAYGYLHPCSFSI